MIRLFANMLSGHMAMLVLTCLIFISRQVWGFFERYVDCCASMLFNIFMNTLELLVAFIQAYVYLPCCLLCLSDWRKRNLEREVRKEATE